MEGDRDCNANHNFSILTILKLFKFFKLFTMFFTQKKLLLVKEHLPHAIHAIDIDLNVHATGINSGQLGSRRGLDGFFNFVKKKSQDRCCRVPRHLCLLPNQRHPSCPHCPPDLGSCSHGPI
jgi:hypothetical protein